MDEREEMRLKRLQYFCFTTEGQPCNPVPKGSTNATISVAGASLEAKQDILVKGEAGPSGTQGYKRITHGTAAGTTDKSMSHAQYVEPDDSDDVYGDTESTGGVASTEVKVFTSRIRKRKSALQKELALFVARNKVPQCQGNSELTRRMSQRESKVKFSYVNPLDFSDEDRKQVKKARSGHGIGQTSSRSAQNPMYTVLDSEDEPLRSGGTIQRKAPSQSNAHGKTKRKKSLRCWQCKAKKAPDGMLPCRHAFCTDCVMSLRARTKTACPRCSRPFRTWNRVFL